MALIVSAATGNFNAGATWVGGVVPGVGDEARAATGHTITITANVTCDEISNAGTGTFILNNGVTLTANCTAKTTTLGIVVLSYSGNTTASIVGAVTGNTNTAQSGTNRCIQNTGAGTLNITGNCSSSGASNSNAVVNTSTGTVNIVGNVSAGGTASQFAGPAVINSSTGNIFITGNVTASDSQNSSAGVTNASTGTITVIGTITAAQVNPGIQSSSTGPLILTGPFIMANNGRLAVYASFWRWASTIVSSTYFQVPTSNLLATRNLVTDDNVTGMPAVTNVRSGTVYGPTSSLTGTCAVPAAGSVALGVPVGSTTGTATLTAQNMRDAMGLATANLDTQLAAIPTAITNAAAVRTNLATELGRIDATISSRSTLTAANVRTELTPELTEIGEIYAIHGLDIANALTVTPTLRSSGAITQAITGDGTTSTIVTRV